MTSRTYVAGVGMIPFVKPGANAPYHVMGAEAAKLALADAGLDYGRVQQAYVGYVYGDSTCGQRALYPVGMTGIPIVNVNNNCSTGSTALFLARQAIESGAADCVMALGFEQMKPGALGAVFTDRPSAFDDFDAAADKLVDAPGVPLALRYFGGAGLSHMKKYGTPLSAFAKVRAKASRHAKNNPLALFRKEVTADDVMNDQVIWPGVMTRLMACPPTCGGAAAILVSEKFADQHGLNKQVRIAAQAMTTDTPSTFGASDMMQVVGYDMARDAAKKVYEAAGIGPDDLDVVELHDCFAHNELITYEGLGLCGEGEAARFIDDGDNSYGGRIVTNPSGGLLSKGHPLGATGLAQCFELTRQLRGTAAATQVEGARIGLQHNLGLGGACVVTLYERA
ncbi:sterol carrier protein 2 [Bradyrhizobium japonicum]|jgi:sterol carrier protein 2|uniref:propanoyl-CoA C-acyltransferase n=1 Tax=Bradyrhizobium elkanii TaxID=29448 RepID=A0A4Q4K3H6_BRAEL|nr:MULTISPECIES: lipid-transfer protein [Bradyrhizobium]MBP1298330.1 acetyl-CoA acetyltransferase [Bradyrhizobium elkanii]MCP1730401.1 acetyl-CoA acetyltransferase [Bradyrhizobium elkanii]MCP1757136.1 acetyl-CoA acetyltransferase [Bradyrhizobium elkanii]MCP1930864.1 acetyl-CoA acetyltransferase [Bradyrhizobium elkanii]MCP1982650.1 acetyl-CoA acetyltransferase [Bradyrhizobium elkanii]